MRISRLKRIYPAIEPKLRAVAFALLSKNCLKSLEIKDLIGEGLLAIKNCSTTKKNPKTLSYLIQRAKYQMLKIVKFEQYRADQELPIDDLLN